MPLPHAQRVKKYLGKYSHHVIIRDNDLHTYNHFLQNAGETKTIEDLIDQFLKTKTRVRVLDIGCGNGQALHELKERFSARIHTIGIDLLPLENPEMLDEFIQGDVHEAPLPQNCDLILSFRSLHEMGNLPPLIPRIALSLTQGGRAYLWVRMRDYFEQKIVFSEEMSAEEEKGLLELSHQALLNECKTLVEPILQPNPENPDETFVAGYVVLLYKTIQS